LTLSASIKTSSAGARQTIVVWSAEDDGPTRFVRLGLTPEGRLEYQELGADGRHPDRGIVTGSNVDLTDGSWHSVSVVRAESGSVQLGADGVLVGRGEVEAQMPAGLSSVVPSSGTKTDVFNGSVEHIRVYNELLSQQQLDMLGWRSFWKPCGEAGDGPYNATHVTVNASRPAGDGPDNAPHFTANASRPAQRGAADEAPPTSALATTTREPGSRPAVHDAPAGHGDDDDDDDGAEVCSLARNASSRPRRRPWAMALDQLSTCYRWAQEQGIALGDFSSRNWCWVGIKEVGCHRQLWGQHGHRPHLSWEEMSRVAANHGAAPAGGASWQPLLHPDICDRSQLGASNANWTKRDLEEARQWFAGHVEVFVLNLARDAERLQQVQERFHELRIGFTRVEGVDLSRPGEFQSVQREGLIPATYDLAKAHEAANDAAFRIGGIKGTAGCAAAHFRAQARAIYKVPDEYYAPGPVKLNGSSVPHILINATSQQCSVGSMHFGVELEAQGNGLRWLISYGDSWKTGFSIGVDADGQLLCLAMGKRLQGGSIANGQIARVTAEWDGSHFRCGIDGKEIGHVALPGGLPCQKQAAIGAWFSGYLSHIQFGVGLGAHRRKPLALVFEDDAHPSDDFVVRLWHLVRRELPCDWTALSLRSMCSYGACISPHLARVQPDPNEPADRCRHGVNYGFQGVLYRLQTLPRLRERWRQVVFDATRPHCLDIDVALASISDEVGYYAVPYVQVPGLLQEADIGSSRVWINDH
jgi:hypothetical protein